MRFPPGRHQVSSRQSLAIAQGYTQGVRVPIDPVDDPGRRDRADLRDEAVPAVPTDADPIDQLLDGFQAHGLDAARGRRLEPGRRRVGQFWWLDEDTFERLQRALLPLLQPGNPASPTTDRLGQRVLLSIKIEQFGLAVETARIDALPEVFEGRCR